MAIATEKGDGHPAALNAVKDSAALNPPFSKGQNHLNPVQIAV